MPQNDARTIADEIAPGERIMLTSEVAAYCRIGLSTLRQYLHAGIGPAGFKPGGRLGSNRWKFRRADVDAWLDASRIVRRPRPGVKTGAARERTKIQEDATA